METNSVSLKVETLNRVVRIDGNLIPLGEVLSITEIKQVQTQHFEKDFWRFTLLLTNNCTITIKREFCWYSELHGSTKTIRNMAPGKDMPFWTEVPHSENEIEWASDQLRDKWLAKGALDQIHKELVALWKPGAEIIDIPKKDE